MQVVVGSLSSVLPLVKAGRLRALAVTSPERSAFVPALPTVAESGVRVYEIELWFGVFGPQQLPQAIVARLDADLRRSLDAADMKQRLAAEGAEPAALAADAFSRAIARETAMWRDVAAARGIKPD